jgi:hypothetical protein
MQDLAVNTETPTHLIGCGILRREVDFLIRKNGWNLTTEFLDSSLHIDLKALRDQLTRQLEQHRNERPLVFYGCCHPAMDDMIGQAKAFRIAGQNCVEILLGKARFASELEAGAYFLLEDWAHGWEKAMTGTFGHRWDIARAIFHEDRKYVLAIRTPLSGDFTEKAEAAAASVDLPLRWTDTGLDHLEQGMLELWNRRSCTQTSSL